MFLTVGHLTVAQPQTAGRVSPHHNCERCQCSAGHAQVPTHQLQRSRRRVPQLSSFARLVERYSEGVETQGTPLTWSSSKCPDIKHGHQTKNGKGAGVDKRGINSIFRGVTTCYDNRPFQCWSNGARDVSFNRVVMLDNNRSPWFIADDQRMRSPPNPRIYGDSK